MKLFIGGEMGPWPEGEEQKIRNQQVLINHSTEKPLEDFLLTKNYGSGLVGLAVIPMCFKPGWMTHYNERTLYRPSNKTADYRLKIDYDAFVKADESGKRALIIKNIIQCVRLLGEKLTKRKIDFDAERMEKDIRTFLNFHEEF